MPFWDGIMEEIELRLENETPFCVLSKEFPALRIYRWCSSVIDYIEVIGDQNEMKRAMVRLDEVASDLHSQVISSSGSERRQSTAISCRCTVGNSTIRSAESMNLLWEAPAVYQGGFEFLKLISFSPVDTRRFFEESARLGEVQVLKKRTVQPDSLRETYTLSLADILGDLSEKQVRYLRDAIGMGLFTTPRKILVEDLARIHGVSKSTMQEHINKARNKLIQAMEPYLNLFMHSR